MIYKNWIMEWLEKYVKPTVKKQTYERYTRLVTNHIIPNLGDCDMDELRIDILQNYVTSMSQGKKPLSTNMIRAIVGVIKRSLVDAKNFDKTKRQSATKIVCSKTKEKKIQSFTLKEQKEIEQYVLSRKNPKLLGIIVCLYTGLRVGELLSLKWEDIDLKKRTLHVNRTCYYGRGDNNHYCRIEDTPKTSNSLRTIPLNTTLVTILKNLKKTSESEYVVSNKSKPISIRSYQKSFELLQKKLHIPHKCFHSLRHTFATRAIESGMDVKTLSEILGHKNAITTLNRYAHSLMDHKKVMIDKLGKYCKF